MAFRYKRGKVETACFLKRQAHSGTPRASAGSWSHPDSRVRCKLQVLMEEGPVCIGGWDCLGSSLETTTSLILQMRKLSHEQVGNLPKAICLVRGERRIKPEQSRVHQQPSPKAITFFS